MCENYLNEIRSSLAGWQGWRHPAYLFLNQYTTSACKAMCNCEASATAGAGDANTSCNGYRCGTTAAPADGSVDLIMTHTLHIAYVDAAVTLAVRSSVHPFNLLFQVLLLLLEVLQPELLELLQELSPELLCSRSSNLPEFLMILLCQFVSLLIRIFCCCSSDHLSLPLSSLQHALELHVDLLLHPTHCSLRLQCRLHCRLHCRLVDLRRCLRSGPFLGGGPIDRVWQKE